MKRAAYFVTCDGKMQEGFRPDYEFAYQNLTMETRLRAGALPSDTGGEQLSLFSSGPFLPTHREEYRQCLTGEL